MVRVVGYWYCYEYEYVMCQDVKIRRYGEIQRKKTRRWLIEGEKPAHPTAEPTADLVSTTDTDKR